MLERASCVRRPLPVAAVSVIEFRTVGCLWRLPFGHQVDRIDRLRSSRRRFREARFFKTRRVSRRSRPPSRDRFRHFLFGSTQLWRSRFLAPPVDELRSTRLYLSSSARRGRRDCGCSPPSRCILRPGFHVPGPRFRALRGPISTHRSGGFGPFGQLFHGLSGRCPTGRVLQAITASAAPSAKRSRRRRFNGFKSDPTGGRSPHQGHQGLYD